MALKKELITTQGFICPTAYIVITEVIHYKTGNASGRFDIYKDAQARFDGLEPIRTWNFTFDYNLNSELNIVAQAYLAIKATPEYSDCVDA